MKRTPIRQVSAKRRAEKAKRDAIRAELVERYGERCTATSPGIIDAIRREAKLPACRGPLVLDEIVSRARRPGGHLDATNVQLLCTGHNGWKEDHPADAVFVGLAANSWAGFLIRCDGCGLTFTEAEWIERHDEHEHECPNHHDGSITDREPVDCNCSKASHPECCPRCTSGYPHGGES